MKNKKKILLTKHNIFFVPRSLKNTQKNHNSLNTSTIKKIFSQKLNI
jgi:hypothetical protein